MKWIFLSININDSQKLSLWIYWACKICEVNHTKKKVDLQLPTQALFQPVGRSLIWTMYILFLLRHQWWLMKNACFMITVRMN